MTDETSFGSTRSSDLGGYSGGSLPADSPLLARAAFFQNWDWKAIVRINRGLCERAGAQHGINPEAGPACEQLWTNTQPQEIELRGSFEFLRHLHKSAPFLFFNGNTFGEIGRTLADSLFSDLPAVRRRVVTSSVAHFVAGVLDEKSLHQTIEEISRSESLGVGDRVSTLKGTLHGVITGKNADGTIRWRPDSFSSDINARPESLKLAPK